jgi:peptidoglycan-associated lipoprotein
MNSMNKMVSKSGVVAVLMGMILLSNQGCGMKWLQSGGESESGSAQSGSAAGGASSNLPGISRGGSSGELSGFSRNPSEERLAQAPGGFSTSLTPSDLSSRRRAELTKEEKAALEAGLQDVFFGYDQWTVSNLGMEALNRDASYLKDHSGAVLKIEGHCDERGTSDYNLVLGDKRAKAARSYLIEAGVNPMQVAIVSYGKERPFCFDREESCYQQNRRGHMLLGTKK